MATLVSLETSVGGFGDAASRFFLVEEHCLTGDGQAVAHQFTRLTMT